MSIYGTRLTDLPSTTSLTGSERTIVLQDGVTKQASISQVAASVPPASTTLTGDVTGTGVGTVNATLATVNATPGTFGSSSAVVTITVNAKGLVTAASNTSITPAAIGAQPADADLSAIANLSSTGFAVRTGADVWAQRSIIQPASGITITNSDGVSGNPTLALSNDLAAIEGLSSTGFAVRTGADVWAQRSITSGTAVSVSNGSGVSGNPIINYSGGFSDQSDSGISAPADSQIMYYRGGLWRNSTQFTHTNTTSGVNGLDITGSTTGNPVIFSAFGTDTNINLDVRPKGSTGVCNIWSNGAASVIAGYRSGTGTPVNQFTLQSVGTGFNPRFQASGADANVGFDFTTKGTGTIFFQTNTGTSQFSVANTASAVNRLEVTGSATGTACVLRTVGSDANIDLSLEPKGTGLIRMSGGSFIANGTVAVTLGSLGPTGAATTVQRWLRFSEGGTIRYIPCW